MNVKKYYWIPLLLLIFISAFWVRLIPANNLEYPRLLAIDPYFFYRMGEHFIEHGTFPEADYLAYHTPDRRLDAPVTTYSYLLLYYLLIPFGFTWYGIAMFGPPLFGALQVVVIFFLTREVFKDNRIALLASALMAGMLGIIFRTSAGFMEKEPAGVLLILVMILFFIKALNVNISNRRTVIYSVFVGVMSVVVANITTQIQLFWLMAGVFFIVTLLLNKYNDKMLVAFLPMFVVYVATMWILGTLFFDLSGMMFISNADIRLSSIGLFLLIQMFVIKRYKLVSEDKLKYVVPVTILLFLVAVTIYAILNIDFMIWFWNNVNKLYSPLKGDIIASTVAESKRMLEPLNGLFHYYGNRRIAIEVGAPILMVLSTFIFSFVSVLVMAYEYLFKKRHNLNYLFVSLFFVVLFFLSINVLKLIFFASIFVSITAAYGIFKLFNHIIVRLQDWKESIDDYVKLVVGLIIALIVVSNFASGFSFTRNLVPIMNDDWYNAIVWLKHNTPQDAILLQWWDYGYWYQTIGNKITLLDGGHHPRELTQNVAKFYTEPFSNKSLELLKKYNISYVMTSPDLVQKFGTMSTIAKWGEDVDYMFLLYKEESYTQDNKTINVYKNYGREIIVGYYEERHENYTDMKNLTVLTREAGRGSYLKYIGIGTSIVESNKEGALDNMIYFISDDAIIYIPKEIKDSVYVKLQFYNGEGLEKHFKKVYSKGEMNIYGVNHD